MRIIKQLKERKDRIERGVFSVLVEMLTLIVLFVICQFAMDIQNTYWFTLPI